MRVLIIGGNRFLGLDLGLRLLAQGHQVALLNRGNLPDPFGGRVERLRADRGTDEFDRVLAGRSYDAIVDFALFDGPQAERTVRVLASHGGPYILISTGQVYLVREGYRPPAREEDYAGPLLPRPTGQRDLDNWTYGIEKRQAEEIVAASSLRGYSLRLPMVHGLRDYRARVQSLLWRVLDGGPLLVANAGAPVRHVYGPAVTRLIERLLSDASPKPGAWNLAQAETLSVREVIERIAFRVGVVPKIVEVEHRLLEQRGLDPVEACAFSGKWMSCLDASRASAELGFTHEPFEVYLNGMVDALLAQWSDAPVEFMAQRPLELAAARDLAHGAPGNS